LSFVASVTSLLGFRVGGSGYDFFYSSFVRFELLIV
jgi:hypothetical protein